MRTDFIAMSQVSCLMACGGQPLPPPASADEPPIGADQVRETPGRIAYTVPAAWTVVTRGPLAVLTAQEGDVHVVIADATATQADAAVSEVWAQYRSAPKLKLAVDAPAREGWDQVRTYVYETSPNERRVVQAIAFRHGAAWSVALLDASLPTLEKRAAQLALVAGSLRPKGHERESFAGRRANKLDAGRLAKLDVLIERGRQALGVPGVAIAIVQDGQVIAARGYGVRELGKPAPVDADSQFMIASLTKALSTLLLARLVDEGKLRWDQPVREVYPDFKLGDAATTAAVRIEHLVSACTGLPRNDMEWLFGFADSTPRRVLADLASVQPTTKFGETFQYSNQLAAAAGFIAAHVTEPERELGQAYDAAMKTQIFAPLGMNATTFDFRLALRANHASPHSWDIDGTTRVAVMELNRSIAPLRPAGGAWSSVNDLIKYIELELSGGLAPNGKRLVSEQNLLRRREKHVAVGERAHYGMGLGVDFTYSTPIVEHNGSLWGYRSHMFWLPEHGVGAVILTNAAAGAVIQGAFRRCLLEQLFDGKPEAIEDMDSAANTFRQLAARERERMVVPADSAAAAGLARRYVNPKLGGLSVSTTADATSFDFGEWKSVVASRKNGDDTLSFISITPGVAGFEFVASKANDGKRQLVLRDAQHEYPFTETAT